MSETRRGRITHDLKTWPDFFTEVHAGRKNFEVRKRDRDYQTGDFLRLLEFDPKGDGFTGREVTKAVRYILPGGAFGVEAGYCVMGLSNVLYPVGGLIRERAGEAK